MRPKTRRFICLILGLAVLGACQGRCRRPQPEQNGSVPLTDPRPAAEVPDSSQAATSEPGFAVQEVQYCRERTVEPKPARVQLLLDASGSMNGFTPGLPPLVTWIEHAISGLRGTTLELASAETCLFNRGNGIGPCLSGITLPEYAPATDTNLHHAIRRAANADLTLILTDGVAATGVGGDAECATGVDASCVARALREAIRPGDRGMDEGGYNPPEDPSGEVADPGIWVMPLVTSFRGRFFTEELISPQSFDPEETLAEIRDELNERVRKETEIREPQSGRDGRLIFHYQGPKALLLIVIARQQKLGRDAVWSLWEQASLRSVTTLDTFRQFDGGLVALPPIEVYPGYWNPIRFETLEPVDDPAQHSGTLDVAFNPGPPRSRIWLDCPPEGSGEGVFTLRGQRQEHLEAGSCVPLRQLPAYVSVLEADYEKTDGDALRAIVREYQQEGQEEVLRLNLFCGPGARRLCTEERAIQARWAVKPDFRRTAAGLAGVDPVGVALRGVREVSTIEPSRNPHLVFGLTPTLKAFYELVEPTARRLPLAELEVCNGSAQ